MPLDEALTRRRTGLGAASPRVAGTSPPKWPVGAARLAALSDPDHDHHGGAAAAEEEDEGGVSLLHKFAAGAPLGSLVLSAGGLTIEMEAVRKIIEEIVDKVNATSQEVSKVPDEIRDVQDSFQHCAAQLARLNARTRDCEELCKEVRLQVGTSVIPVSVEQKQRESSHDDKAMGALAAQIDQLTSRVEACEAKYELGSTTLHEQYVECTSQVLQQAQLLEEDFKPRLEQGEDDRSALKAELGALHQSFEESSSRKATKVEVADLQAQLAELDERQRADHKMLDDAHQLFAKLDGLSDVVYQGKQKMQEMWHLFEIESRELRSWSANGFSELRTAVRSKMDAAEASTLFSERQLEARELGKYVAEMLTRVETDLRRKADASDLGKLQRGLQEQQNKEKPRQLLVGTRCLACDKIVSPADTTDEGAVSLQKGRQQEILFDEVQRALSRPGTTGEDGVLKYVAIHVGSPGRTRSALGGVFESRDMEDHSPGSHHLLKAAAKTSPAGVALQRSGVAPSRSPPREVPALVRIATRRPRPPSSHRGPPRPPFQTLRSALQDAGSRTVEKPSAGLGGPTGGSSSGSLLGQPSAGRSRQAGARDDEDEEELEPPRREHMARTWDPSLQQPSAHTSSAAAAGTMVDPLPRSA